jgi:hypothetical protein
MRAIDGIALVMTAYQICTDSIGIDPPSTPSARTRMISLLDRAART